MLKTWSITEKNENCSLFYWHWKTGNLCDQKAQISIFQEIAEKTRFFAIKRKECCKGFLENLNSRREWDSKFEPTTCGLLTTVSSSHM